MLFNVKRKTLSTPILTVRLVCTNGFREVLLDSTQLPPTSRNFDNEPVKMQPLPEGTGGICEYQFESTQKFKFLGQDRTQDIRYESYKFGVNGGDK